MPMTKPIPVPSTPTGRYVLEEWENEGGPDPQMARAILAIEAEARSTAEPLDVERLAEATWNVNKRYWEQKGGEWPASFAGERNQSIWLTEAEAVVAEYARLTSPESDR